MKNSVFIIYSILVALTVLSVYLAITASNKLSGSIEQSRNYTIETERYKTVENLSSELDIYAKMYALTRDEEYADLFAEKKKEIRKKIAVLYKTDSKLIKALNDTLSELIIFKSQLLEKYLHIAKEFDKTPQLVYSQKTQSEIRPKRKDAHTQIEPQKEDFQIEPQKEDFEKKKSIFGNLFKKKVKSSSSTSTDNAPGDTLTKSNTKKNTTNNYSLDILKMSEVEKSRIKNIQHQEFEILKEVHTVNNKIALLVQKVLIYKELDSKRNIQELKAKFENSTFFVLLYSASSVILLFVAGVALFQLIISKRKYEFKLKKIAKEKQNLADSKQRFVTSISHELRTPLHAIIGFSEKLNSKFKNDETAQIIQKSAHTLLDLVNNVLDYSLLNSNKVILRNEAVNLKDLISEIAEMMQISAEEKGLDFKVYLDDSTHQFIETDSLRMKQVLLNLLSNAVKYTAEGSIVLNAYIENSIVIFKVKDTGIGIPEDKIQSIFEEFETLENIEHSIGKSTGLGLSITRKITQLMGGKISVESKVGVGSEFTVHIPIKFSESITEEPFKNNKKVLSKPFTAICIDDEPYNLKLLKYYFENEDSEILFEQDSKIAASIIATQKFDIIFTDIQMNHINGVEILKLAKNSTFNHCSKVVALTASAGEYRKLKNLGFDEVLIKPFTRDNLFNLVNQILENAKVESQTTTTSTSNRVIFSLDELKLVCGGNKDFMNDMLIAFLDSIQNSLPELKKAQANSDKDLIDKNIHKILPALRHIKATEVIKKFEKIRTSDQINKQDWDDLQSNIDELILAIKSYLIKIT